MSLSFQEIASLWKTNKRQWIKDSSYAAYAQIIKTHLNPSFGTFDKIDEACVQNYVNSKLSSGLSVKTVKDTLVVLKMVLSYGEKLGEIGQVKFKIHFPTSVKRKSPVVILSPVEQRKLYLYLHRNLSPRNIGILICLYTGVRIGEICALQWKDIDLLNGTINISKTIQRIWLSDDTEKINHLVIGPPKTSTSAREIPISHNLMKILRPLKRMVDDDFFVISGKETPIEPRYYRDYFRKILLNLGMQPVRFHALRHSFATRCIESKCDYKTVSAILGHASLSTTMDLYVHPGINDKKQCIEKMARMLGT